MKIFYKRKLYHTINVLLIMPIFKWNPLLSEDSWNQNSSRLQTKKERKRERSKEGKERKERRKEGKKEGKKLTEEISPNARELFGIPTLEQT